MIRSFIHNGIEAFFATGSRAGIQPVHATKLKRLLAQLEQATSPVDMILPGWHLHPLKDERAGHWSVRVNGDRRITFRFVDGDAELVDYLDCH